MSKECLLSVMIPNYNHGHFLKDKLSSALKTLPENSEILVIDDASTDDSVKIIQSFVESDSRVRLICNSQNLGPVKTANLSLKYIRGRYVYFSGADDITLPGMFEKCLKVLLKHPSISLCCSDCAAQYTGYPDRDPHLIYSDKLLKGCNTLQVISKEELAKQIKRHHFYIPGHTIVIKTNAIKQFGGFDESLGYLCDWFLNYSVALRGGIIYIPETLAIWRVTHKTYSSSQHEDITKKRPIYLKILKILSSSSHKDLRGLFKKADALHFCFSPLFLSLLKFPLYYDLIIYELYKKLKKRVQKHLRSIKKRLPFRGHLQSPN